MPSERQRREAAERIAREQREAALTANQQLHGYTQHLSIQPSYVGNIVNSDQYGYPRINWDSYYNADNTGRQIQGISSGSAISYLDGIQIQQSPRPQYKFKVGDKIYYTDQGVISESIYTIIEIDESYTYNSYIRARFRNQQGTDVGFHKLDVNYYSVYKPKKRKPHLPKWML